MTELEKNWQNEQLKLDLGIDLGEILLSTTATAQPGITTLYYENSKLIGVQSLSAEKKPTRVVQIKTPETIEAEYFERFIINKAKEKGIKLEDHTEHSVPANQQKRMADYWQDLSPIITLLGLNLVSSKSRPAKAQHRWNSKVAKVKFSTIYEGTRATIYWRKRNEVVILSGAKMKSEPELNANGKLGFAARFATQLRQEHVNSFAEDFITVEDVVLKSINEVGLFLYFGNTNSWLQFKDENNRTIDEWTIVK